MATAMAIDQAGAPASGQLVTTDAATAATQLVAAPAATPAAPEAGAVVPAVAKPVAVKKPEIPVARSTGFGALTRGMYNPAHANTRASRDVAKIEGLGKLVGEVTNVRTGKYTTKEGKEDDFYTYSILVRQIPKEDNKKMHHHVGYFFISPEGKASLSLYHTLPKAEVMARFNLPKTAVITHFDYLGRPASLSEVPTTRIEEGSLISFADFSGGTRFNPGTIVQLVDPMMSGFVRKEKPADASAAAGAAAAGAADQQAAPAAAAVDEEESGLPQSLRGKLQFVSELPPSLSYSRLKALLSCTSRPMTNLMEEIVVRAVREDSSPFESYVNHVQFGCTREEMLAFESMTLPPPFSFIKLNVPGKDALVFTKQGSERRYPQIQVSGTAYQAIEGKSFTATFDVYGTNNKKLGCQSMAALFGTEANTLWIDVANHYLPYLKFFGSIVIKVNNSMVGFPINGEVRDRLLEFIYAARGNDETAVIPIGDAFSKILDVDGLVHFRAMAYLNSVYPLPESLWNVTVPVTVDFLKTFYRRFATTQEERGDDRQSSGGRIYDGQVVCLSALPSEQALNMLTDTMEANGELRVMIGQQGKYAPHVHLLTNLTPKEGAELVASMVYYPMDFELEPELAPLEVPDVPDKYEQPPFNFNKKTRLLPNSGDVDTRIIAYAFPGSAAWRNVDFSQRFDVTEYPSKGRITVRAPAKRALEDVNASDSKRGGGSAAATSVIVDPDLN